MKTRAAVGWRAHDAFAGMAGVSDEAVTRFFEEFALRLEDEGAWGKIAAANEEDVAKARARGQVHDAPRGGRQDAARDDRGFARLAGYAGIERTGGGAGRARWLERRTGAGAARRGRISSSKDVRTCSPMPLGFCAAAIRSSSVSEAMRWARRAPSCEHALVARARESAGLPAGAATLVDSEDRAAGWAMFSDRAPRARGRARLRAGGGAVGKRRAPIGSSQSACTGPAARGSSPTPPPTRIAWSAPFSIPSTARSATRSIRSACPTISPVADGGVSARPDGGGRAAGPWV